MDLRQLEMFHAVAERSGFTPASEHLHVAQSAISRKVKLLEQELSEPLFRRANKRVYLTPAGEVMLSYTRRIFQELRHASLEVSNIARLKRGTVRIGTGMTACMYQLPPVLEKFQSRYPRVDIRVVTGPTSEVLAQIENSVLDVGVVTLPVLSRNLEIVPFTAEEMVVVTSPRHVLSYKRRSLSLADLADQPMIMFAGDSSTRKLIDQHFQSAGLLPKVAMEAETVATIKPLVRINLGISILPLPAVKAEVQRGELRYLHLRGKPIVREIGLVYLKSDELPKPLHDLIRLFKHHR
jgi:DNA-binding transcriptional LysR family regulator